MSDQINTNPNNPSVQDFIASIPGEQTRQDSLVLIEMMQRISSH